MRQVRRHSHHRSSVSSNQATRRTPINKSELIDFVAERTGLSKAGAGAALDATLEGITQALKQGQTATLIGFGTFEVRERGERTGRNPQTGEEMTIKASKAPAFKPGKALKDAVN